MPSRRLCKWWLACNEQCRHKRPHYEDFTDREPSMPHQSVCNNANHHWHCRDFYQHTFGTDFNDVPPKDSCLELEEEE
jgi:hypothetical protein